MVRESESWDFGASTMERKRSHTLYCHGKVDAQQLVEAIMNMMCLAKNRKEIMIGFVCTCVFLTVY